MELGMEQMDRYDELCRLCATYDAVKMDLFGQEGKNRQLVDKIQILLPFKVRTFFIFVLSTDYYSI